MQGLGEEAGLSRIASSIRKAAAAMRRPFLLCAATAILCAAAGCSRPPAAPPFHATEVSGIDYGRNLRIADDSGALRTLADYTGKVTLVFFGFTSCPDICPTTLARLAQVRKALGVDAASMQVLLITVDPERDTAARLAAYARSFDPSFIGLRPEPAALPAALDAFHAIAVKMPVEGGGPDDYTVDHSGVIYVYDRGNRLRLIVQPDFRLEDLTADLARLAREK